VAGRCTAVCRCAAAERAFPNWWAYPPSIVTTATRDPARSALLRRASVIGQLRAYNWNHTGAPRAAIASSIDVVAPDESICR